MPAVTIDERGHALYAPSASHRWDKCAYSLIANAKGGPSSVYAEEGTAGHALLDLCLMLGTSPHGYLGKLIYKSFPVTDDMADAVALAADWVNGYMVSHPAAQLHLDLNVDPGKWLKISSGKASGTLDVAIEYLAEELVIIDYKHGVNVFVDAIENTQLLQYAFAYYVQRCTRPFKKYTLVVIQPRHPHADGPVRTYVITHAQLMAYGDRLKKRITAIEKNPTAREAGDHCTFCNAAGSCVTLRDYNLAIAKVEFSDMKPADPKTMKPEEIFSIILHHGTFEKWLKAVYAEGMALLLKGKTSKQVKLVLGQRHRKVKEGKENLLLQQLCGLGFSQDEVAPRSLIGIGKMEELFKERIRKNIGRKRIPGGKKEKLLPPVVTRFIGYTEPPLHIAPIKDPRPAFVRGSEFSAVPLSESKK